MNRCPPATSNGLFQFCPSGFSKFSLSCPWLCAEDHRLLSHGAGLLCQRTGRRGQNGLQFVVAAELSRSLPLNFGLDTQTLESHDVSELRFIGPVPGDVAEVEAYCRIFRAAENLHITLMDALCDPVTGECTVSYDSSPWEDKIVTVLGCMVSLLNKGRQDVLSGRSSIMASFRATEVSPLEVKLTPLGIFRGEIKRCCESLHVALENILEPGVEKSCDIWRKLQRLKNVCYDLGFPRLDDSPGHGLIANWAPVCSSTSKDDVAAGDSEIAFWKGGQVTEEGLRWLMERGFKTIVDLRQETVKDGFFESALNEAVESGKIQLFKLPVEIGMAPSMKQVEEFASLVSDIEKRPIYLHSREGVWRTSAMVTRWRQFTARSEPQVLTGLTSNGELAKVANRSDENPKELLDEVSYEASAVTDVLEQKTNGMTNGFVSVNPLKAQLPPPDILCRKSMSAFMKSRKISHPLSRSPVRTIIDVGNSNGSRSSVGLSMEPQRSNPENGSAHRTMGGFDGAKKLTKMTSNGSAAKSNGKSSAVKDSDLEVLSGDMCASATGVVRVQSRKKAEMFLVRTDGISCTRERVNEASLAFSHPTTQQQMLMWKSTPKTVLLLKKLGKELMEEAKEVASFLHHQEKMDILVEPDIHDIFARMPGFGFVQTFYSQDTSDLHEKVDLVACLGGDGVILHASNLFKGPAPPVVSFNLGSLGFLTSHLFEDHKQDLRQVIHGNNTREGVYITLRMRLRCEIFRNGIAMPGKVFDVLNEVVVDRGSNPYLSKIECYEHDRLITKVQGDGVIIATPTGSTAYSTAAGGSMVHPNVPCILFTPICPHSLSFRPVILPDSARLELKIPEDARSNAWVSFDGKRRQQLSRGDSVRISMSEHPLPTVNKLDQTGDWFHSLLRCLNWNERKEQKAL